MDRKQEEIVFITDLGEEVAFQVIEQTRLGGVNYLLVSTPEDEDGEAQAIILKDISKDTDIEAIYDIVEDERELENVAGIFRELLDDIELI
ncbi:MAG TPA: DUF1292 domain-containing protein [Clostridiales bacterium]|nr:DUF1292 domain-containing protein [Clostridiales bacterium]